MKLSENQEQPKFMPLPPQRWLIAPPHTDPDLTQQMGLQPITIQLLHNRGMDTPTAIENFLAPSQEYLPDPRPAFREIAPEIVQQFDIATVAMLASSLDTSIQRLQKAIGNQEKIAICGDYDVDGMTSTALLLRTFRLLGGIADYAIPSRMTEGYGINDRIVQEFQEQGISIVITVDNGIAAYDAIHLARELGMAVIVTDHHDIPPQLPPAYAILNPKLLADTSPFATIAGVGVAYILALELATELGKRPLLENSLLELFTLGTIADLAELSGINRTLVKRGLTLLPQSEIVGVQALIHQARVELQEKMKPEAIGFRLGPRINAVGRIGDPQVVITLLTTEDWLEAEENAKICETLNLQRQQLCLAIEQQAVAFITQQVQSGVWRLEQDRFLLLIDREAGADIHWHHGVIGIVASRLVERYGAPVFIGSVGENQEVRFSVRGIPEFHVFASLEFIADIRGKGGGHKAAGGFSMPLAHVPLLRQRLALFADREGILPEHIQPLLQIDGEVPLAELSLELVREMELLQPCGIGNPDPLLWSRDVRVLSQKIFGKENLHLGLILDRGDGRKLNATAWRWSMFYPIPEYVDIAYSVKTKTFQGETSIELEIKGMRTFTVATPPPPKIITFPQWYSLDALQTCDSLLIYGYQRPEGVLDRFGKTVHYDRPQQRYQGLILWSLPPSVTHLQWLIGTTQPQFLYIGKQIPQIPSLEELRQKIAHHIQHPPEKWNLLSLGQAWWVNPATIVAGLRELGYRYTSYPPTDCLAKEIEKLDRWYSLPWQKLRTLLLSKFELLDVLHPLQNLL